MRLRDNLMLDRMVDVAKPTLQDAHAILLKRAEVLSTRDRQLVELALKNNLTHRQLAEIMACPPGTICRRLRRLKNRLCDPMIVALIHPRCPLPADYQQLAIEHMLHRKTITQLSREHHLPRYEVKHMLEFVRGWHRGTLAGAPSRQRI